MNKIYERTGCNTQEELIEYIDRLKNNPKNIWEEINNN